MNRFMQWVMAAALICSSTVFTSCMNDDNPVTPVNNLSEKIIGKWMTADIDGRPAPTNEKTVMTFLSATKALVSLSLENAENNHKQWSDLSEYDVLIEGNKITNTNQNGRVKFINEFIVNSINDAEMICNFKHTTLINGETKEVFEQVLRLEKVVDDYHQAVVGIWQGHCTSEGSIFDDGQEHRWQYNADGTYVYYVKDSDNWVPNEDNTLNEYFVDGNLLCTRWIDRGQENREWWEITISGDKMNWTALRANKDGSTYTATFEMKKVE